MDTQRLFDALDAVHPVPETEKERLRPHLRGRSLERNAFFVRAGERSDQIGYLLEGILRYFYTDSEGREYTRYFCRTGNFVSAANSTGTPSLYSIQCLTPTKLVVIPYGAWQQLMEGHPVWGRISTAVQERALRMAEVRERSLILDSALERYLSLLEDFPGIEAFVKQYDIANYLGISPQALSRIRAKPVRRK